MYSISSGVLSRPSAAFRFGNRSNRLMIWRWPWTWSASPPKNTETARVKHMSMPVYRAESASLPGCVEFHSCTSRLSEWSSGLKPWAGWERMCADNDTGETPHILRNISSASLNSAAAPLLIVFIVRSPARLSLEKLVPSPRHKTRENWSHYKTNKHNRLSQNTT